MSVSLNYRCRCDVRYFLAKGHLYSRCEFGPELLRYNTAGDGDAKALGGRGRAVQKRAGDFPAPVSIRAVPAGDELFESLGPLGCSVDALAAALGLPVSDVLAQVARLETSGLVVRSGAMVVPRR